jgi:hypothetical protein
MDTTTINGLHKCQPKNTPEAGTIKNMVVLNMPAKNGKKAWIKIKSEKPEKGGSPYRLLNVEPLDWPPDDYGNIAFNIEVEATTTQPSAFNKARETMQQGESRMPRGDDEQDWPEAQQGSAIKPESPTARSNGEQGVMDARKHLVQSANLYNLCVKCVNSMIADELPEIARTSEQFQAAVSTLFIESSSRRTSDGVNWWSYVDKMPDKPITNGH